MEYPGLNQAYHLKMSVKEREVVMKTMSDNFASQDEPKVGIFWYSKEADELFGISKIEASELQFNNDLKTIKTLHKSWWQKQKNKAISTGKDAGIFIKDYTQVPRGRIFQRKDGVFQLMCGSWIDDHIIDLVKEEFDLKNTQLEIKIDEHWEIGHGWSEEEP
jgi:hypothetical protein